MSKETIIDIPTIGKTGNIVPDISRARDKPDIIRSLDPIRDFVLERTALDYSGPLSLKRKFVEN